MKVIAYPSVSGSRKSAPAPPLVRHGSRAAVAAGVTARAIIAVAAPCRAGVARRVLHVDILAEDRGRVDDPSVPLVFLSG